LSRIQVMDRLTCDRPLSGEADLTDHGAVRASEQSPEDLSFDQRREHRRVGRVVDQAEQSERGVEQFGARDAGGEAGCVGGGAGPSGNEHLDANLAALDVALSPDQLRRLDEVSAPTLDYPAPMHGAQRAMLQFAGATVDGEPSTVYPPLLQSAVRY
jgi:hypothetical protein